MIVQMSILEEANGPRSLLAIEMNKDTLLCSPILSINLPTLPLSTLKAAKPDDLQRKNCSKVLQLGHSINLKDREGPKLTQGHLTGDKF